MKPYLVLYHDRCHDGYCAAYIADRALPRGSADYTPMAYGTPLPRPEDLDGRDAIYVLDFAVAPAVVEAWRHVVGRVVVIDHHPETAEWWGWGFDLEDATPEAGYRPYGNVEIHYTPRRSGAGLTWAHFMGDADMPPLVRYVEDWDLWHHHLEGAAEVHAYLGLIARSFVAWAAVDARMTDNLVGVITVGSTILQAQRALMFQAAENYTLGTLHGHPVVVVNYPVSQSELGAHLTSQWPDRIAVIWHCTEGGRHAKVSFRSARTGRSRELAGQYGGGGHPDAAGAVLPLHALLSMLRVLCNADPEIT